MTLVPVVVAFALGFGLGRKSRKRRDPGNIIQKAIRRVANEVDEGLDRVAEAVDSIWYDMKEH